ncbi:class I SAM-dependent methyltransferase [Rhizohabitans arisaemae]|uniref:class I SAM-dependent methyltransferase n=1 Tax=Rhizohabitans arisaemae TaxID=2720610 RepID=UPI0024B08861|nr:class I SAM-dependent methyltransferase [Rhizohabitans arisaemae]
MTVVATAGPKTLDQVTGWFPHADQLLFEWFLNYQAIRDIRGDLLELGVYFGKSAIFTGRFLREGETFTVCDLFESEAPDAANRSEMSDSYSTLQREAFEANYRAFHPALPRVVQGPSSTILNHVRPGTCRFVHIDASHLYEHVKGDIVAARTVLDSGGIVVLDDYRTEHTPGVAAAVWEAVFVAGLRPICLSGQKFYGTWGDPAPWQHALLGWAVYQPQLRMSRQRIAGARVLRAAYRAIQK